MTKKEYLIKVFSALEQSWEPAKWFVILLKYRNIDQNLLDILVEEVKLAVNEVVDDLQRKKLQKTIDSIEILKRAEEESRILDQNDISKLDFIIEQL